MTTDYSWGQGNQAKLLFFDNGFNIKLETIVPDSGEAWHFHKETDQWFLPVTGRLKIVSQRQTHELEVGDIAIIPRLESHKVWNTGSEPCIFYLISKSDTAQEDKYILEAEYEAIDTIAISAKHLHVHRIDARNQTAFKDFVLKNSARLEHIFAFCIDSVLEEKNLVQHLTSKGVYSFGLYFENKLAGCLFINKISWFDYTAKLHWQLDGAYKNRQFIELIILPFLEALFLLCGIREVNIYVHPENKADIALLEQLDFEKQSTSAFVIFNIKAKQFVRLHSDIRLMTHEKKLVSYFTKLNQTWIEDYFVMEIADKEVLYFPEQHIIKSGGQIFYAALNDQVVATGALKCIKKGVFELTKMATDKSYQGLGLGAMIIEKAIEWAHAHHVDEIVLYTQSSLFKAARLYKSVGFKMAEVEQGHYDRANVKMVLKL